MGAGRGKGGSRKWEERERLTFCSIVINIIYSILLVATAMMATIGLTTYQWVETTDDKMLQVDFSPPINAPGLTSIHCGLGTYCVEAAGQVSDCALPWPKYGNNPSDVPFFLWAVAGGFIATGIAFVTLCWLYTIVACFGLYSHERQECFAKLVDVGGLFMFVGLLCFGASLDQIGVSNEDCRLPLSADGSCNSGWFVQLPSPKIEGEGNQSCRICPENAARFGIHESCSFGWGGILVIVACILCFISSAVGHCVTPRVQQSIRRRVSRSNLRKTNPQPSGGRAFA
mmetsp:Transcript_24446/g.73179  ORF Transcript_24446/g.73179 Transcript_24446/m.73179 type:complete len:286 (-) Transcript_24446:272-1129(-)